MTLIPQNWAELLIVIMACVVVFGLVLAYTTYAGMPIASLATIVAFIVAVVYIIHITIKDAIAHPYGR